MLSSLFLLFYFFLSPSATFLEDELPLNLTSIIPSPFTPGKDELLRGRDSITLVFSRPVIALGSDVEEHVDYDVGPEGESFVPNNPFHIVIHNAGEIHARIRWVTTFIARLDPINDWNTDLRFTVSLNRNMDTHDGISLRTIDASVNYVTPEQQADVVDVFSERTIELTDGLWNAEQHSLGSRNYECPPDAQITLRFHSPVIASWIESYMEISARENRDMSGVDIEIEQCDFSDSCVLLRPRGLHANTPYQVTIPEGSQLHSTSGLLTSDIVINLWGLLPFTFDIQSYDFFHVRYDLWLRHGLCDECTLEDIADGLEIRQRSQVIPFHLERPNKGTLRIVVQDITPDSSAEINFTPAPSNPTRDGFDQPLEGFRHTFGVQELGEFWEQPSFWDILTFEDFGANWRIMSRGGDAVGHVREYFRQIAQIGEISIENIEDLLVYDSSPDIVYTGADNQAIQPERIDEFEVLEIPIPGSRRCPANTTAYDTCVTASFFKIEEQDEGEQYRKNVEFVLVTDLAVSVIVDDDGVYMIWVTRMSSGLPVENAEITIYEVELYEDTWRSVDSGTTDREGIFTTTDVFPSNTYSVSYSMHVQFEEYQSFMDLPRSPSTNDYLDGTLITDRAQYKPGDVIYVKGYYRDTEFGRFVLPNLDLEKTNGQILVSSYWNSEEDECPRSTEVFVDYDVLYGSFSAEVPIPDCASPGTGSVSTNVAHSSFVISDPRRPTGFMTLWSDEVIYRPAGTFPLEVLVTTGTEVPIQGAEVTISWRLTYARIFSSWDFIRGYVEENSEWVNFEVTTDENGLVSYDFSAVDDGALVVKEGDSVEFLAEWIDPTGALVQESLIVEVRSSEWTLDIETSINDPMPGINFGLYISATDWAGNDLFDHDVEIELLQNEYNDEAELIQQTVISTCNDATTDGGDSYQCGGLMLPVNQLFEYTLRGTMTDDRGVSVTRDVILGKTREVWEQTIVTQYDPLVMFLDKSSYFIGETAYLALDNPFVNAYALLKWGNIYDKQYRMVQLAEGYQRIPVEVSEDTCIGSCLLKVVLHVPRQGDNFPVPEDIPFTILYDYQEPRIIEEQFNIEVVFEDRHLEVEIELSEDKTLPGSSVDITVQFSPDTDGRRAESHEIAIYVIDKAYLEIEPNPIVDVAGVLEEYEYARISTHQSLDNLAHYQSMPATIDTFTRRMAEDPWLRPNWRITPTTYADVDKSDEQFWDENVDKVTSFPSIYSFTYVDYTDSGISFYEPVFAAFAETASTAGAPGASGGGGRGTDDSDASVARGSAAGDGGDGGDGGGGSGGSSSGGSFIEARDNFQIVPFFMGNITTRSSSKTISVDLPDNIGTFTIRAYVVDSESRFGNAETELVVSKPVALEPKQPRFARIGDRAEVGVSVIADDPNYDQNVLVSFGLQEDSTDLVSFFSDEFEKVAGLSGASPMSVTWPVVFSGIGDASWTIMADDGQGGNTDALLTTLQVKTVMDPIFVATSMAVTADEQGSPWTEWIDFPEVYSDKIELSDGSNVIFTDKDAKIEVEAGVGRLVAIQSIATQVVESYWPLDIWRMSSDFWLSITASQGAFDNYPPTESQISGEIEVLMSTATAELSRRTDSNFGLRNYEEIYDFLRTHVDISLNTHGLYLKFRQPHVLSNQMTNFWADAVEAQLIEDVLDAFEHGYEYSVNNLAKAFLVFGPEWIPDIKDNRVKNELSLANLRAKVETLAFEQKLDLALMYLLRDSGHDDELVLRILNELFNNFRVQGQTAYVGYDSNGNAQPASIQSKALTTLLYAPSEYKDSLLIEKLANHLSQSSLWLGTRSSSLVMISLADYDEIRDTLEPDLEFTVVSGDFKLIDNEPFRSASQPPVREEYLWTEVSPEYGIDGETNPDPVEFIAKGEGEVSVSIGLRYMPPIYDSPVYRGILVERMIRRVDPITRSGFGSSIMLIEGGEFVEITVQITTPDTLYDVRVEDRVPAGLEPLDPNLFEGVDTTQDPQYWYWYYWSPFQLPQLSVDNVLWKANSLSAGTYTMTYQALSVTPGVFIWPPTHAYSDQQEEVTGLSSGGSFVVTSEIIPEDEVTAYLQDLDVQIPDGTVQLQDCEKDCSSVPGAYCNPYTGECVEPSALVKSQNDEINPSSIDERSPPSTETPSSTESFDPCATVRCAAGHACDSFQDEAQCNPKCDLGYCGEQACQVQEINCIRAPCWQPVECVDFCVIEVTVREESKMFDRISGLYSYDSMDDQNLQPRFLKDVSSSDENTVLYFDHDSETWRLGNTSNDGYTFAYTESENAPYEEHLDNWLVRGRDRGFVRDDSLSVRCLP